MLFQQPCGWGMRYCGALLHIVQFILYSKVIMSNCDQTQLFQASVSAVNEPAGS